MNDNGYVDGFIERTVGGSYQGNLIIDDVDISPIVGVYFTKENNKYLYLKRKKILEYNDKTETYQEREALPKWEVLLKKQTDNNAVSFKGEFFFFHFRYSILGVWDKILGTDKKRRLNFIVERMNRKEQTIINKINERKLNK